MASPSSSEQDTRQWVTFPEAVRLSGHGEKTLRRWITQKKLASEKLPTGRLRVSLQDLSRVTGRQIQAPVEPALGDSRLQQIVALAEQMGEERGRLLELADTERERGRREGMEHVLRELLKNGITLQNTG